VFAYCPVEVLALEEFTEGKEGTQMHGTSRSLNRQQDEKK